MVKHEQFPLSEILYYRIGGVARFLLEAQKREDVLEALHFVQANAIDRLVVVGLGSNLLFPDGPFDGAVLRIATQGTPQIREMGEGLVQAFAGEELDTVINFGFAQGCVGLQWAGGLPGTVGAAVRGNVGAFGGELKDVLDQAEVLTIDGAGVQLHTLGNQDLRFSYRDSLIKRDRRLVVLSAIFRLQKAGERDLAQARQTYHSNIEYRHRNHPMEYPTCGSVFKNIGRKEEVERILAVWPDLRPSVEGRWHGKVSMGHIIDRFGLSGHQLGGAQISPKHNNFIVNLGDARASDVYGLIEMVKERFFETFGFLPEVEVEIVGQNP
ncbi:MAG: UDP-N-acetylmuramate dehydrogenase [Sphingomonadaceae bacterium]